MPHETPLVSDGAAGPHRRPRWRDHRGLAALLLATALATCTNDRPTGPGHGAVGYLAFRPVLVSPVDLTAFGLTIDSLRVAAIRPVADTVVDTTVFFDPNASSLTLRLPIELRASSETFKLLLELRAGRLVLFAVTDTVVVSAGAPDTAFTPSDTLKYVGPGAGITRIVIAPVDSVVTETQTAPYRVTADAAGVPVDSFYVSWSTSDTAIARINAAGVLRAPNTRGAVFVRAVTPTGKKDSTRVTFIPVPNAIALVTGGGQTGVVATRLTLPLRVKVTAADLQGIKGIPVQFQAPATGSVRNAVVVTDSTGVAQDSVTLGTTTGLQNFQATVTGLTPLVIAATATPGAIAPALSVVTVSAGTVGSGASVTLRLQTKDAYGNNLTAGGATVVFGDSGGTSTGAIGTTTDNGDGTYQTSFLGLVVGTATTITATVNGIAVTTARPRVAVTAGAISTATSVVSTSSGTVSSGANATLTLQARDSVGNLLTAGGAPVLFTHSGGTSTGTIGATTDHLNGTYTATFTADSAGTATTIGATIGGVPVVSTTTITVVPGNTVAARSVITVSADTIPSGGTSTLTLQAKDATGNNLTTGGLTVVFSHSGGTSTGSILPSPATDNNNGTYTAVFTGDTAGTATTIHATIGGVQVTSTLPTITVFSTVHVSDITADSTWTTAASPHIVNGYLKITNGANLTIQAGAVVKFNAGSGLQVGDTAANQAGDLALDGTAGQITLTANSVSPTKGFWKGIEVQRSLAVTSWRNVLIEWAGGTRAPAGSVAAEACILLVDNSGSSLDLDQLHIRQCNHAGIHHFGGSAHVHRSEIDTVTGSAIHADFDATLELDTTVLRGAANSGLEIPSPAARLLPSSGNVITGNAGYPVELNAGALPGLYANSVTGNGRDTLVLDGGVLTATGALLRVPGVPWRVRNPVTVDSGAVLTIDADTVFFDDTAAIVVGGGAGAALRAFGTSTAPLLLTATPGHTRWGGLLFEKLSQPDTLRNVIVEKAGLVPFCQIACEVQSNAGSIWYLNTTPNSLLLDSVTVRQAVQYAVTSQPSGSGAVVINNSQFYDNAYQSLFYASGGLALTVDASDIYHYRTGYPAVVIVNGGTDSVTARNNWWGDVSGPGLIPDGAFFNYRDSLSRDLLFEQSYPVAYLPFATTPHFPVGSPATVVAVPQAALSGGQAGQPLADSIRVRVEDGFGRGVGSATVTWSTAPGNGTLLFTNDITDPGGRAGADWSFGTVAKTDTGTANSGSGSTPLFLDVAPGPTTLVDWQLIPSLTPGGVSTDSNAVTYTSSNHQSELVAHAVDEFGNFTLPSNLYFTDVPNGGGPQSYGTISLAKRDTVIFTPTVSTPSSFQLHGQYSGASGFIDDSVLITVNAVPAAMRINQDTAQFNSVCPTPPTSLVCSRLFLVELLDSAGTPLPSTEAYQFQWLPPSPGTAVTLDSTRGVMNEIAFVTARANGADTLIAQQSLGQPLQPSADTLAITVQQVAAHIFVSPVSTPVGLGDTVTFTASVADAGGQVALPPSSIHWRADPPFGPYLAFIDTTSVAGTAKVRLDSVYRIFGSPYAAVTAFAVRPPGGPTDTLTNVAVLINPIQVNVSGQGANPVAAAVNPKTGNVYVVNAFTNPGLVQVFDSSPKNIATVQVDMGPHGVAVDPITNRVYVVNQSSETMSVIEGATNTVIPGFLAIGPNSGAVAVDTVTGLAYVAGQYCFDFPATCSTPFLKIVNGTTMVDSIQLPADGRGIGVQYNAGSERLFVSLANDTVVVIDPSTKMIVDSIGFPSGSFLTGVAANSITKRVYVAEYSASQLGVIDGTPGVDTLFTNTFISVNNPNSVSVNETRNLIYSAATSNTLVIEVDGATNNVIGGYYIGAFGDFPLDAVVNAADQRVYVPHNSALTALLFYSP